MTVMVAILTAAVLVLAVTDHGGGKSSGGASTARVRALNARVSALDARVASIQQNVAKLAARKSGGGGGGVSSRQLQALGAQLRAATQCLFQAQKEIDDLEAFLAYRAPLRRTREHVQHALRREVRKRAGEVEVEACRSAGHVFRA